MQKKNITRHPICLFLLIVAVHSNDDVFVIWIRWTFAVSLLRYCLPETQKPENDTCPVPPSDQPSDY